MSRLVMHIDLDAFYAAVEQRDHPEWRGRPVVVGAEPGRRGVVATCSYEARRYGVHSAMPIAEAARRLPPDTLYVRPRMADYARVSRQIMAALETLSPVVEQVSIDEAYLDVSGLERLVGSPQRIGQRAKSLIQATVGLTASVGIGPNRLIAKLASEYRKPDGLTLVPADRVQSFLDPMPLTALRGLGAKTAPLLQRLGLRTVADVRGTPLAELRRHLGAQLGTRIHAQAHGIASDAVQAATDRKSISKETTFEQDVSDPTVLRDTLQWAAQEVGYLARSADRKGAVVMLKIRLQGFETHTRSRTLPAPTDQDGEIFRTGWSLYRAESWGGRPVRLIGLGLSGWAGASRAQSDLFDGSAQAPGRASDRLYATLDEISRKFGRDSIRRGLPRRK